MSDEEDWNPETGSFEKRKKNGAPGPLPPAGTVAAGAGMAKSESSDTETESFKAAAKLTKAYETKQKEKAKRATALRAAHVKKENDNNSEASGGRPAENPENQSDFNEADPSVRISFNQKRQNKSQGKRPEKKRSKSRIPKKKKKKQSKPLAPPPPPPAPQNQGKGWRGQRSKQSGVDRDANPKTKRMFDDNTAPSHPQRKNNEEEDASPRQAARYVSGIQCNFCGAMLRGTGHRNGDQSALRSHVRTSTRCRAARGWSSGQVKQPCQYGCGKMVAADPWAMEQHRWHCRARQRRWL